jgi:hypothetical protein
MRVERLSRIVFTPLEDGAGVLLNLETQCYYNLNKTGASIWLGIEAKTPNSLDEIVTAICEQFDVAEDAALIDTRAFLEHLARFKMVRLV